MDRKKLLRAQVRMFTITVLLWATSMLVLLLLSATPLFAVIGVLVNGMAFFAAAVLGVLVGMEQGKL